MQREPTTCLVGLLGLTRRSLQTSHLLGTLPVDSRFLQARPSQCPGRAPCVSPSPSQGVRENEKDDNGDDVDEVKPFEAIPGPRSLPVIGTLHHYLPLIGQFTYVGMAWWEGCICVYIAVCVSVTSVYL